MENLNQSSQSKPITQRLLERANDVQIKNCANRFSWIGGAILLGIAFSWLFSGFLGGAEVQRIPRYVLFSIFLLAAMICFLTAHLPSKASLSTKGIYLIIAFNTPLLFSSALIERIEVPVAFLSLVITILVSYLFLEEGRIVWIVLAGICIWLINMILGLFMPFIKIDYPACLIISSCLLVGSLTLFGILSIKQFIDWTQKKKLFALIISVTIVPATLISYAIPFIWDSATQSNEFHLSIFLISVISTLSGIGFIQSLTQPLSNLVRFSKELGIGNSPDHFISLSNDETGEIGQAINQLIEQNQLLMADLENRVRSRTADLAAQNQALISRIHQYQVISEVTRSISTTQDFETFLSTVTRLISERFNYYHVGIFLLNDSREYAVLRASNSEGGQRLLAKNHRLLVGQVGIVGYVTGTGNPRIAHDVGEDTVYFNNPDLPQTHSEMALPLRSGEKILGALDIQSTERNAFTEEIQQLFLILADQIAIAITNNILYEETAWILEETQNVYRQHLRQEWGKSIVNQSYLGYRYSDGATDKKDGFLIQSDIESKIQSNDGSTSKQPGQPSAVVIPIRLRGEEIGVIRLLENQSGQDWSEDELASVQSVADQIALSLENARLFEQTARRADRERKVIEITSKIRSTNDVQTMLQIALQELQSALNISRAQILLLEPQSSPNSGGDHTGNDLLPSGG